MRGRGRALTAIVTTRVGDEIDAEDYCKCGPEASTGPRERIASVMRAVVFIADTVMDDQFDRRELLLHPGDMLETLSCLAKTGRPDAPAAELAKKQEP
jgi:hypothetical protein